MLTILKFVRSTLSRLNTSLLIPHTSDTCILLAKSGMHWQYLYNWRFELLFLTISLLAPISNSCQDFYIYVQIQHTAVQLNYLVVMKVPSE
jgi:hypothetical protein